MTPDESASTRLSMNGARPTRVADIVTEAGGRIIDIRRDGQQGEWPGYLFTVSKGDSRKAIDVAAFLAGQEAAIMSGRASILLDTSQLDLESGQVAWLDVRVRNQSAATWCAAPTSEGVSEVRLGNHWLAEDGSALEADDGRADLVRHVEPGQETQLKLKIRAPTTTGQYILELDMVREGVAWFKELGSETTRLRVHVS